MNDAAYDISYLLDHETTASTMADFRSARPSTATLEVSQVVSAQQTLASELLQMEGHHEEMIRQYMSVTGVSELDTHW